eukprot:snap_masked-scaffold_17-processed-gene-0.37-mRNA-1 protein AED:0.35 eAED:0.35 QI:0/-1/0/1/-1/1/1/0/1088
MSRAHQRLEKFENIASPDGIQGVQDKAEESIDFQMSSEEYADELSRRSSTSPEETIYLYCIIFPVKPTEGNMAMKLIKNETEEEYQERVKKLENMRFEILRKIQKAGFVTQLIYTSNKKNIICKVGCNDKRLLDQAEFMNYKLEISSRSLKYILELKAKEKGFYPKKPAERVYLDYTKYTEKQYDDIQYPHGKEYPPLFITDEYDYEGTDTNYAKYEVSLDEVKKAFLTQSQKKAYRHIHMKYDEEWEEKIIQEHGVEFYRRYRDKTILKTTDRIYLTQVALEQDTRKIRGVRGAGLDLMRLQFEGNISAHFPIQFSKQASKAKDLTSRELFSKFFSDSGICNFRLCIPWRQPIEDLRNYTGEKIAYYFAFLEFYSMWLIPTALAGIIVFAFQLSDLYRQTGSLNIVTNSVAVQLVNLTQPASTISREELEDLVEEQPFTTERTPFAVDLSENFILYNLVPTELPHLVPAYSVLIALWAAFFLEFWKRRENILSFKWGTGGYTREAVVRPEFESKFTIPDAVTGLPVKYSNQNSFKLRVATSSSIILTAVGITIAAFFGTYVFRVVMSSQEGIDPTIAVMIALVINAVAIYILQYVFKYLAKILTDWENHRTDLAYENYLIGKTFVFSFFNSYTTLAYFAFFKRGTILRGQSQFCVTDLEQFDENNFPDGSSNILFASEELLNVDTCYGALGYSLIIIFMTQIFMNNAIEIGLPMITNMFSSSSVKKAARELENSPVANTRLVKRDGFHLELEEKAEDPEYYEQQETLQQRLISPAETQFLLSPYLTPFNDYLELAIQFGYVTLFVSAFPLAPTLALLNNFVEVWVDAKKVCTLSRRPYVEKAMDIGTWLEVFTILSYIAVVVNSAVLVFSSIELIPVDDEVDRVWAFLGFIVGIYFVKYLTDFFISDIPYWVKIQNRRQHYFEQKIFYDDEESDDLEKEFKEHYNSEREQLLKDLQEFEPLLQDPYLEGLVEDFKRKVKEAGQTPAMILKEMDKNNNQIISLKELEAVLDTYLENEMTPAEINFVVQSLDFDGDGKVEKEEVLRFFGTSEEELKESEKEEEEEETIEKEDSEVTIAGAKDNEEDSPV